MASNRVLAKSINMPFLQSNNQLPVGGIKLAHI